MSGKVVQASKPSKESGGKENFYKRTTQALAVLLLTTVTAGTGLHYSKMSRASTEYSSLLDSHTDLVQKLEGVKLDYSTLQERYAAIEEQLTSVHDKFTSLQGAHSDLRSKLMSGIQKYLPQGDSILRSIQENVLEKLPVDLSFNDNAESVEASSFVGYLEQGVELGSDDWVPVSEGRGLITGQDLTAEVKDDTRGRFVGIKKKTIEFCPDSGSLISRAASFLSKLGVPAVVLSVFAYAFKKRGSIAVPVNAQNQHSSFVSGMAEKLREVNGSDMMKKLYGGVVLDPHTAYPKLILSRDGKRLRLGNETRAVSDDNPERFDYWECAVGQEGFTSGRHFWEVDVGENQHWKLGVARASAQRKGEFSMLPRDGYWTLWWYGDQLWALTDPLTSLAPGLKVQKVGVSLVYDEGRLSFYNVESGTLLYTFTEVFIEKLYPFFWTWDTSTDLVIL
ncbi:UNVERIFIED_CONTAM: hypothetical protein FKN15_055631 [Acipenser sinensis]